MQMAKTIDIEFFISYHKLQSLRIKNDSERSVIRKTYLHIRPKTSFLHYRHRLFTLRDNILIHLLRHGRRPCLYKAGSVSLFAVGVQSKLGYEQKAASHCIQKDR